MSNLQTVTINQSNITVKTWNGKRVVTFNEEHKVISYISDEQWKQQVAKHTERAKQALEERMRQ